MKIPTPTQSVHTKNDSGKRHPGKGSSSTSAEGEVDGAVEVEDGAAVAAAAVAAVRKRKKLRVQAGAHTGNDGQGKSLNSLTYNPKMRLRDGHPKATFDSGGRPERPSRAELPGEGPQMADKGGNESGKETQAAAELLPVV
jgi:hypothetical protein